MKDPVGFATKVLLWCVLSGIYVSIARSVFTPNELDLSLPEYPVAADETDDNVFHWIHLTDLHIDMSYPERTEKFRTLLTEVIPLVNPVKTFLSGDLTHALIMQEEEEWDTYRDVVIESGLWNRSDIYIDLRGNHDATAVYGWEDPDNYYRTHSVIGSSGILDEAPHAVFDVTYSHPTTGTVRWTLFDASSYTTLDLRFNLYVTGWTDELRSLILSSLLNARDNYPDLQHVFAVGHYPSQQYGTGPRQDLEDIADLAEFTAYMCGHTHQDDWWLYRKGWAELELGDFQYRSRYRIYALDNSVLAHVDATVDEWPVVLVTNPKNAKFLLEREPLGVIGESTHIRVLGWSPENITSGVVMLDGEKHCDLAQTGAKGELWTCEWDPTDFAEGIHEVEVTLVDGAGREGVSLTEFSVDGSHAGVEYKLMDAFAESDWSLWGWGTAFGVWFYLVVWRIFGPWAFRSWLERTEQAKIWDSAVLNRLTKKNNHAADADDLSEFQALKPSWIAKVVTINHVWATEHMDPWVWRLLAISGVWVLLGPHQVGFLTTQLDMDAFGVVWSWGASVVGQGTFGLWEIMPFTIFWMMTSRYPTTVLVSRFSYEPYVRDYVTSHSTKTGGDGQQGTKNTKVSYRSAGLPTIWNVSGILMAVSVIWFNVFYLLGNTYGGWNTFVLTLLSVVPVWTGFIDIFIVLSLFWSSYRASNNVSKGASTKTADSAEPAAPPVVERTASETVPETNSSQEGGGSVEKKEEEDGCAVAPEAPAEPTGSGPPTPAPPTPRPPTEQADSGKDNAAPEATAV